MANPRQSEFALKAIEQFEEQLNKCVNFWLSNAVDEENGGLFNMLDEKGVVYDKRKNSWLLGRAVWTICQLYCDYPKYRTEQNLNIATSALDFIESHMMMKDGSGRVFFSVSGDGRTPISIQRKLFGEVFYCLALLGMARAAEKQDHMDKAITLLSTLEKWSRGTGEELGLPIKELGSHNIRGALSVKMMLLSLALEVFKVLRGSDGKLICSKSTQEGVRKIADEAVEEIKHHCKWSDFYQKQIILESIGTKGEQLDSMEGNVINPGHAIELGWFLLDYLDVTGIENMEVHNLAVNVCIKGSFDIGWDKDFGGIYYFLDRRGLDPEALEWNMKLWWPHCECLIASLYAYRATKDAQFIHMFEKVWEYTLNHFVDNENGEWYGYLDRSGNIVKRQKGGQYKGFFHVPRCLMMCHQMLEVFTLETKS